MNFVDKLKKKLTVAVQSLEITSDEVIDQRIATCNSCEYFTRLRRCNQCGCFMDAKTKFVIAKCPINKW